MYALFVLFRRVSNFEIFLSHRPGLGIQHVSTFPQAIKKIYYCYYYFIYLFFKNGKREREREREREKKNKGGKE